MTESPLDAETRLAVRNETEKVIGKLATIFGVANIAVLIGGLWFMWTSVTDQAAGLASSVKEDILAELRTDRAELDEAVRTANQLIGKLEQSQNDMGMIENDIDELQAAISNLSDRDAIEKASIFLEAWKGAPALTELTQRISMVEQKVSAPANIGFLDANCSSPRVVFGRTDPAGTDWQRYNDQDVGIVVDVDATAAGFSGTPQYFTSLGGSSHHWFTTGATSIYGATRKGFKSYIRWPDLEYNGESLQTSARKYDWHINWIAVGC